MDLSLDHYTIQTLAEQLVVTEGCIKDWIRRGLLPEPKRLGNLAYWPGEQIRERLGLSLSVKNAKVTSGVTQLSRQITDQWSTDG